MFSSDNLLKNSILLMISFVLCVGLILKFVPITEQIRRVKGVVGTNKKPLSVRVDEQLEIKDVFISLEQPVLPGDLLVTLNNSKLEKNYLIAKSRAKSLVNQIRLSKEKIQLLLKRVENNKALIEAKNSLHSYKKSAYQKKEKFIHLKKDIASTVEPLALQLKNNLDNLNSKNISAIEKADLLTKVNNLLIQMEDNKFLLGDAKNEHLIESSTHTIDSAKIERERISDEINLADVKLHLSQLEEEYSATLLEIDELSLRKNKMNVYADAAGKVVFISDNLETSNIVEKNETILSIQPESSSLQVELALTDKQFKDARSGQNVLIEVWAWNHFKHGVVTGRVSKVSSHKITTEFFKKPTYIAYVTLDESSNELDLYKGFNLTASIDIAQSNLLYFILKKFNFEA